MSHSSKDTREAIALKAWLTEQRPELGDEIFIDVDSETGLKLGEHWKTQLFTGKSRCEHFICLLSQSWASSTECNVEYRTAEGLGKRILVARLEDLGTTYDTTSAWQRCDLFAGGEHCDVEVPGGPAVRFNTAALTSIMEAVDGSGTGPRQFVWPPRTDPNRAPYRGWEPFEEIDAGVFFGHTGGVTSLAFFGDGRHLVSGSQDDTLRMWEVSTGKTVGDPMKGHTGTVTGVSVSSNGHRIMSGSEDKYLRLWDADSGKPIGQPLAGHSQAVNSVAFSPDRHRVVSASDDGELRLWPAPPKEDWVNLLCDKLSANPTHAEWDRWVSPNIEYIKLCPNLPDPPSA